MAASTWYKVGASDGDHFEYLTKPSMRQVKADLGITGRRIVLVAEHGQWKTYRLCGTTFTFTLTMCF